MWACAGSSDCQARTWWAARMRVVPPPMIQTTCQAVAINSCHHAAVLGCSHMHVGWLWPDPFVWLTRSTAQRAKLLSSTTLSCMHAAAVGLHFAYKHVLHTTCCYTQCHLVVRNCTHHNAPHPGSCNMSMALLSNSLHCKCAIQHARRHTNVNCNSPEPISMLIKTVGAFRKVSLALPAAAMKPPQYACRNATCLLGNV